MLETAGNRLSREARDWDRTRTPSASTADRAAGNRPVDVWYLPNAGHTAAIREAAPEYERRVTEFFASALLR